MWTMTSKVGVQQPENCTLWLASESLEWKESRKKAAEDMEILRPLQRLYTLRALSHFRRLEYGSCIPHLLNQLRRRPCAFLGSCRSTTPIRPVWREAVSIK